MPACESLGRLWPIVLALGAVLGLLCALGMIDADEGDAYRRGLHDGIAKCSESSRLERAVKWVVSP